jgi:hypothetical protein
MTAIMDNFTWWKNALAGNRGPIYDGEPQSGFYRQKRKDGQYEAVAYWKDSTTGEQRCHVNGRAPDPQRALEMWPYASKNPITTEAYWHRIDTGSWNDVDQGANDAAKGPDIDPAIDPAGSLKAEITKARAGLAAYASIDSDEQSAKAQTLRSALTGLKGKAEKAYEAENRPLLEQQKKLREIWFPLRDDAADGANDLRKAMEKWEDIKRENQRRADEETAKRQAEAAAEAEWKGAEPGAIAKTEPEPVKPVVPNTPPPAAQIRGGSGRAASVGTKKVVISIDLLKAWDQFGGQPEVYRLFMDLAQRAVDAGLAVPCATVEEKAVVR